MPWSSGYSAWHGGAALDDWAAVSSPSKGLLLATASANVSRRLASRPAHEIDLRFQTQFTPRKLPEFITESPYLNEAQRAELDNYQDMVMGLVARMYRREQEWLEEIDKLKAQRDKVWEVNKALKARF